jgi:hypothetical protein
MHRKIVILPVIYGGKLTGLKTLYLIDIASDLTHTAFPPTACSGCGQELRDAQALVALEKQWHVWCFKCKKCDVVLHGEYMGK